MSNGNVRAIDGVGRVAIPSSIRDALNLRSGNKMEFYIDGTSVVMNKYSESCMVCGDIHDIESVEIPSLGKDFRICRSCRNFISKRSG